MEILFWVGFIGIILINLLPWVGLTFLFIWATFRSEAITLGSELMTQQKARQAKFWWVMPLFLGLMIIIGIVLIQLPLPIAEFLLMTFWVVPIMLLACGLVSWVFLQLVRSHQKVYFSRNLTQIVVLGLGLFGAVWGLGAGGMRIYNGGGLNSFPFELILISILLAFRGLIPNAFSERGINFNSAFKGWSKIKSYTWHLKADQTEVLALQLDQIGQTVWYIPIPADKKAAVQALLDQYHLPIQPQ